MITRACSGAPISPAEVLRVLQRTDAAENLLEFTDLAEAEEWRASLSIAAQTVAVVN